MSRSPIQNLRADDLGRFILDLQTPAEKTIGKMFGCFSKLAVALAIIVLINILSDDSGILSKLARTVGIILFTGFFSHCRRTIDCYYVLDDVGGQLLYHFSAIMIVSEDPVANLDDVVGIGVNYSGTSSTSRADTWAVVFCLSDGKIIRVSDFLELPERANAIAAELAELLNVPLATCNPGERKIVAVENGLMIQKTDDSFISSVSKDRAAGCLMKLFVLPYAFWPTMIIFMLAFFIVGGGSTDNNIEYYREMNNYAYIDADGNLLPQLTPGHKNNRSRKTTATGSGSNPSPVQSSTPKNSFVDGDKTHAAGQLAAEKVDLPDETASGTTERGH